MEKLLIPQAGSIEDLQYGQTRFGEAIGITGHPVLEAGHNIMDDTGPLMAYFRTLGKSGIELGLIRKDPQLAQFRSVQVDSLWGHQGPQQVKDAVQSLLHDAKTEGYDVQPRLRPASIPRNATIISDPQPEFSYMSNGDRTPGRQLRRAVWLEVSGFYLDSEDHKDVTSIVRTADVAAGGLIRRMGAGDSFPGTYSWRNLIGQRQLGDWRLRRAAERTKSIAASINALAVQSFVKK